MKYKVTQEIKIRSQPSFTRGEEMGTLKPGFIVDVVKEAKDLDSEDIWLKDNNDFFYWKGAVEEAFPINTDEQTPMNFYDSKIPNWNSGNFDVTRFWPKTTGRGIKVAVIDSGIYQHKDLIDAIDQNNQKAFGSNSIEDTNGHGTHVAGIIAARGVSDIYGIAPESIVVPIKVGDGEKFSNKNLIDAINHASSIPDVKVINMSLKANRNDESGITQLKIAINNAIHKGKIIVAPSGNNYRDRIDDPASFDNVIAVSSVFRDTSSPNESYLIQRASHYGNQERSVNICAPGVDVISCMNKQEGTHLKSGTSMAAAYISGIIALKLQKNLSLNAFDILNTLSNSIFQFAPRQINPHNTIPEDQTIKLPVLEPYLFINR